MFRGVGGVREVGLDGGQNACVYVHTSAPTNMNT